MRDEDWGSKYYFFFSFLFLSLAGCDRHVVSYFHDQGWKLCPLHWECRILTTELPGNSLQMLFWAFCKGYIYTAFLGIKNLSSKKGSNEFFPPQRAALPTLPSYPSTPLLSHFFLSANSDTTYSLRMIRLKTLPLATPPSASSLIGSCGLYSLSLPPPTPTVFYSYN